MRFATFAAFMLPLAALAAPITSSDLAKISDPLGRTSVDVESVVSQLFDHKDSPDLLHALQTAQLANTNVFSGTRALVRIINANAGNGTSSDNDEVEVSLSSINAHSILGSLQELVNSASFMKAAVPPFDLQKLQSNVDSAVQHINDTITADIEVLKIQGKSVKQLFDDANIPVPPGF